MTTMKLGPGRKWTTTMIERKKKKNPTGKRTKDFFIASNALDTTGYMVCLICSYVDTLALLAVLSNA